LRAARRSPRAEIRSPRHHFLSESCGLNSRPTSGSAKMRRGDIRKVCVHFGCVSDRGTSDVVSEHQYYGNGFRAGEHYDADVNLVVDSSDPWYWFGYDERWRIVATFVGSDAVSKERFLHHRAGGSGYGGSSYLDHVVLRERDANTNWHASSDGTLEERLYYCQNWRYDATTLVTSGGAVKERVRYSSYGVPCGIPLGDCDSDGDVDSADQAVLLGAWGTSSPKCDLDLSGAIDAVDNAMLISQSGTVGGLGSLSRCRSRIGGQGWIADPDCSCRSLQRTRVSDSRQGRWHSRDSFARSMPDELYKDRNDNPIRYLDPTGEFAMNWAPAISDSNTYGPCGKLGCHATLFGQLDGSSNEPYLQFDHVIALIFVEEWARCCDDSITASAVVFWEDWGPVFQPGALPPTGVPYGITEHSFVHSGRKTDWGSYQGVVLDVRLIQIASGEVWSPPGTAVSHVCGKPYKLGTNRVRLQQPVNWDQGHSFTWGSGSSHYAQAEWECCCENGDCSSTVTHACMPGPAPTCN